MLKRVTILILVLLVVGLVVGCHGVVRKEFDTEGNAASRVHIGDPGLKALIKIVQADTEIVNGHLKVRVLIHNRTQLRRELEYKIVFSDDKGFPLDDPWGWRPVNLEPKGDEVIQVVSNSGDAATFSLQLQRASMEDMR